MSLRGPGDRRIHRIATSPRWRSKSTKSFLEWGTSFPGAVVRRRTFFFLNVVLAAAWLSSGCWFSSPSALSLVTGATDKALESRSVHFEIDVSIEGLADQDDAEAAAFHARGAVDPKNERSLFIVESFGMALEMRVVDGVAYMLIDEDGGWMKFDEDEMGLIEDLFMPLFDPYSLLEELGVDPSDAKHEGSGDVRGKKAERYTITVPPRDVDQDIEAFMPIGKELKVEFWVGEDGLPVRVVFESSGTAKDFDFEGDEAVTFRMVVDLFDYGKPVDVDAPPEDEIVDLGSLGLPGAGGLTGDPFEGAECYADRLDECLTPNPEVDAMAQQPITCQHFDVRVCLVPMGFVRADVIKAIVDFHKKTANIGVVVLPSIPLPPNLLDRANSQLPTKALDDLMKSTYITTGTASTFIGISAIDQQGESYGWWFGHRFGRSGFSNQHGMFSYFRMANVPPYNGDPITDELVHLRASKYAARYTALLLLDHPTTEDNDYLNYYEMFGFSDLDSMGTKWPEGSPPCLGLGVFVCVIPDNKYSNDAFEADVVAAAERIQRETGVSMQVRADTLAGAYEPSKPDWGAEYVADLDYALRQPYHYQHFPIVGVTDDNLAQDATVSPRIDEPHPLLQLSVVSGYGAGKPGTAEHRERMYRLILRGVLVAHFGMELNDDPNSLMFRGVKTPAELDGKAIPAIPK